MQLQRLQEMNVAKVITAVKKNANLPNKEIGIRHNNLTSKRKSISVPIYRDPVDVNISHLPVTFTNANLCLHIFKFTRELHPCLSCELMFGISRKGSFVRSYIRETIIQAYMTASYYHEPQKNSWVLRITIANNFTCVNLFVYVMKLFLPLNLLLLGRCHGLQTFADVVWHELS